MQGLPSEMGIHIEFLLEELSAEAALKNILPKILPADVTFHLHVFEGKQDLLKELSSRLRGYRRWLPDDWRIVILIDEDRQNCKELKEKLEITALEAGFVTKSSVPPDSNFQVLIRLAIEELEAWFLGDAKALRQAYPRISKTFQYKAKYRYPDAITGGTHEALARLLKGYYPAGRLPKTKVAENIAAYIEPSRNTSKSFQVFVEGLNACIGEKKDESE